MDRRKRLEDLEKRVATLRPVDDLQEIELVRLMLSIPEVRVKIAELDGFMLVYDYAHWDDMFNDSVYQVKWAEALQLTRERYPEAFAS